MPMIEFRYKPERLSVAQAVDIAIALEEALRSAVREVRPAHTKAYNVFVEGDPFNVEHNQPDLRVYVFYHADWNFNPEELAKLPATTARYLTSVLQGMGLAGIGGKVRFYERGGPASAPFGA